MLNLVVTMHIKPGHMAAFLAVCAELRPQVLQEPGCRGYDYLRDVAVTLHRPTPVDPDRITLLECWESIEALRAHMETPHMRAAGAKLKDLRESVELRVTEAVF